MKNDLYLWLRIHWKSWEMDDEKSFINMIGIWKWLMKISENGKPIINTSEIIFWIMIWKIMISMRIKMFALNSMEKKCMNKTKVEKALYIKGFRHSKWVFDTVLIPNRIINNGRDVNNSCRYLYKNLPFCIDKCTKKGYNINAGVSQP